MKKIIASPAAPKAVGPYSQAVQADATLYVSGQLPIDAATGRMPDGIEEQTRQSLRNLGHILREAGYDVKDPQAGEGISVKDIPEDVLNKCFQQSGAAK